MSIPLERGFTVVTGPNGSGKSNILDGVLFCLGLATSRGMRADRLPDLVNSGSLRAGKAAETVVSVRFDLSDWQPDIAEEGLEHSEEGLWIDPGQKEWTVTRRLRVMPGGSYSSHYSADGQSCNLQQLQTQLRRLRIDPEGSNVVMQGDVTRIVSMSNRDRRELIDELAGVALFDSRIDQARNKLDDVHERQERCRIVQQELLAGKQRLERDCSKARIYQELREKLHLGRLQESVLLFETAKESIQELERKSQKLSEKEIKDQSNIVLFERELINHEKKLQDLQSEVKNLGEDKLLAVQSEIASFDAQDRELDRQAALHKEEGERLQLQREELVKRRNLITEENNETNIKELDNLIKVAEQSCKNAESAVEISRRRLGEVAGRSGLLIDDLKKRSLNRQELQAKITPLQQENQKLEERIRHDKARSKELELENQIVMKENEEVNIKLNQIEKEWTSITQEVREKESLVNQLVEDLSIQQRTRVRLDQEQSRLEKEVARLESRRETLQEGRGTSALNLLLDSGLEGIHGPVAQLGEVEQLHRLALEVAAGARIAQIVVDNDQIAAKAIHLLKSRRAGRLTFLPLNRIQGSRGFKNQALLRKSPVDLMNQKGFLGRAVDLIEFDSIYSDVFLYVFGETLVFRTIDDARIQKERIRAVTLEGDLIEISGAMTGGSSIRKNFALTFGRTNDGDEVAPIRQRLIEVGETIVISKEKEASILKEIDKVRSLLKCLEQRHAAIDAERNTFRRLNGPLIGKLEKNTQKHKEMETNTHQLANRLKEIKELLLPLVSELEKLEISENDSDVDNANNTWQKLEANLQSADAALQIARQKREDLLEDQRSQKLALERLSDQKQSLSEEEERLKNAVQLLSNAHSTWRNQQQNINKRKKELDNENKKLQSRFGEKRRERDEAEINVSNKRKQLQETQWNLQKLKEDRESIVEELRNSQNRLNELRQNLPNPLPEIPEEIRNLGLENLQNELNQIQHKMEALEPVNMLALEELKELEKRLGELGERLDILDQERSELLLRIETVSTLRQEAFMEAFEAVDIHFREIFASLSDGDGHLQLENKEDPLEGGLTLVAHPKGKAVRRLAAMSGGEKSLTALSFLFALQRFRPSPFYALDEVDSFLDGVNVERLSALIASQAEHAQFLVVSHRRPMIGASQRTIGVTQARGAHTQVVGLPDAA